jgi:N-acetylglutamate synthase-like GNAT family acetyltransferase
MTWTFRAASADDWEQVSALLTHAELPLDGAQAHLHNFMLAFEGEKLAGVAGIERYGDHALLRSVAVTQRGMGLGQELVQRVLAQARAEGMQDVTLLTTTAADFFPRFGFQVIKREAAPLPVQESVEFREACPSSATVMLLELPQESFKA